MQAEIISIGDELLLGQTINTNAAWIGAELSQIGIPVQFSSCIADEKEAILFSFRQALERADIVLVTGGLGPTKDDITKHVLCEYFETELEINPAVLERITAFFTQRGREMLEVNRLQAALPKKALIFENNHGTASGMGFEQNGKILISMPGVPYEMKGLMKDSILAYLHQKFQTKSVYHKTILTTGIGESFLAEKMADWENRIRAAELSLAYLPSPGLVKLRITSSKGESDAGLINSFFQEINKELPQFVYGYESDSLSEVVGELLRMQGKTVGTVESCTGGGIGNYIVQTPGSSAYFEGGIISYSNRLKMEMVGVSEQTLERFGAVSEETVREMAHFGREKLSVDYGVAVSGIAGPEGGSEEKPVGTVWIAVASEHKVITKKYNFGLHRERTIQMTIFAALNLLRCSLLNINIEKK